MEDVTATVSAMRINDPAPAIPGNGAAISPTTNLLVTMPRENVLLRVGN
jgi:hypothetical protein